MHKILVDDHWQPGDLTKASKIISGTQDLADYAALFLRRCRVEAMVHGNVELELAEAVLKNMTCTLRDKAGGMPLPSNLVPLQQVLSIPQSKNDHTGRDGADPWHAVTGLVYPLEAVEYDGHSVELYFQLGPDSLENRVLARAIEYLIKEPMYTELRTRQQVGYVVHFATLSLHGVLGFVIELNSTMHPPHELMAICDRFLAQFRKVLVTTSVQAFHRGMYEIARGKLDSRSSTRKQTEALWDIIQLRRVKGSYEWKSKVEGIEMLRTWVSQKKVVEAYDRWLCPDSAARRRVSVMIFGTSFEGNATRELRKRRSFVTVVDANNMYKRAEWLPKNCVPIRGITDEDFSDTSRCKIS